MFRDDINDIFRSRELIEDVHVYYATSLGTLAELLLNCHGRAVVVA